VVISSSGPLSLVLASSVKISGTVWYDSNGNSVMDSGEGLAGVSVLVSDVDARTIMKETDSSGRYEFQLVPGKNYVLSIEQQGYFPYSKSYAQLSGTQVENVKLVAVNRTVTGTVSFASATLPGIDVTFKAVSGPAQTLVAASGSGGAIAVDLRPGTYTVIVDQDVVAGNNVSRYQYEAPLTISVGSDPDPLDIKLVKRYLVEGNVTPSRGAEARVTISGPDSKEIRTSGTFETYLQEGSYSFYVIIERLGARYVTLTNRTIVNGDNSIVLVNELAFFVQGTVKADGVAITGTAPVVVSNALGGDLKLTTSVAGSFSTYLPAGSYVASVDYHTKMIIGTKDRYVKYQGSIDFEVATGRTLTVPVERQLDNSTIYGAVRVSGQNVAASLELVPTSTTGIWTNVTALASGYSAEVAPGNYSIYIRQTSGPAVFMGDIDVSPYVSTNLDFDLVPGVSYFGVTELGGVPGPATIEFSSENYKILTSAEDGSFEVYLPPDVYQVRATGTGSEQGVITEYSTEFQLALMDSQGSVISLQKDSSYGVDLQWDTAEKQTIAAGESVSYNLRVVNKGNAEDSYTLSASGMSSGWTVAFSQNPVTVGYGAVNSQLVTVTISTPANAKVVHSSISVKASSSHSTKSDAVTMDVGITPEYSVTLTAGSAQPTSGTEYTYKLTLTNSGNIDDTYNVSISNANELVTWGWEAQVRLSSGTWSDSLSVSLSAGSTTNIELKLTPIRDNPDGEVTVVLTATSKGSPGTYDALQFDPSMPVFSIPGGLSVAGVGVSTQYPQVPLFTWVLLGVLVAASTVLILLVIQKGVLKRKKR
jgi:hypothetical protein